MSVEDKIDYVQALWDRIAANEAQVPVPNWHRDVLKERVADYQANPDEGQSWESTPSSSRFSARAEHRGRGRGERRARPPANLD